MGMHNFDVITDHNCNPLILILNHHKLDEIDNPRLQCLHAKIMTFNFKAVWHKGATNQAPAALSCNPVSTPCPVELLAQHDEENNWNFQLQRLEPSPGGPLFNGPAPNSHTILRNGPDKLDVT